MVHRVRLSWIHLAVHRPSPITVTAGPGPGTVTVTVTVTVTPASHSGWLPPPATASLAATMPVLEPVPNQLESVMTPLRAAVCRRVRVLRGCRRSLGLGGPARVELVSVCPNSCPGELPATSSTWSRGVDVKQPVYPNIHFETSKLSKNLPGVVLALSFGLATLGAGNQWCSSPGGPPNWGKMQIFCMR